MIKIGTDTFVRAEDITKVVALSDMNDMSEIKNAWAEGNVVAIGGRFHCTAVYMKDGKIFISPLAARKIRNRIQAADWSNVFDKDPA